MRDDKTSLKSSSTKENGPVVENGKKKVKEERPATKVVVRRLPPTMTEEEFKMQVSPLPDIDYFYFVPADMSLSPNAFCRAYLNFIDQTDLLIFTEKFDGYVFLDSKGGEFPAVVEFAPFQRIPKNRPNRKKDQKAGTIEDDPVFIAFKERLEAENMENKAAANVSKQHFFETSSIPEKKDTVTTPLLEYIRNKRAERQRIRDEKREEKRKKDLERRKVKEEQKKVKKDEDSVVVKVLNSQSVVKERLRDKETKQSVTKKKSEDVKHILKEKSVSESRSKDSKQRTGKSYLEERQRQAERREEQRKKLSQSQSSDNLPESKSKTEPQDKSLPDEDKKQQEKSVAADSDTKEVEFKKEKFAKKEEIKKSSYKSTRDKESEESRKTRRTNYEKTYSSNKKDYDKYEDSGRKRYSESRKSQDSIHKERYREKDKTKLFSQKKSSSFTTDVEKSRNTSKDHVKASGSNDPNKIMSKVNKENTVLEEDLIENSSMPKNKDTGKDWNKKHKEDLFETKDKINPTRRKSLDCDRNRYSVIYSSSTVHAKDKYAEKKRRNSVGSNSHVKERVDISSYEEDEKNLQPQHSFKKSQSKENICIGKGHLNNLQSETGNNKNVCALDDLKDDHTEERSQMKRRNSTGETQVCVKEPTRRNSLESLEYKSNVGVLSEQKISSKETTKKEKSKYEKKIQHTNRDPRTERRIRNKDRPSIEIYRPGMGKFSKQRLEREKVLGSSTEVDSPSSSPSPTPVLKHKNLAAH